MGLQQVEFIFSTQKCSATAKCILSLCEICEFDKACHRSKGSALNTKTKKHDGSIKGGAVRPGAQVSIYDFELRLLGRKFVSDGGPAADKFDCGCIFVLMPLVSCMLSIKLGFLLLRLLELNRTIKICVWNMGILSTII